MQAFKRAATLRPNDASAYRNLANTCTKIPGASAELLHAARHGQALLKLRLTRETPEQRVRTLLLLAQISLDVRTNQMLDEASSHLTTALRIAPRMSALYATMGNVQSEMGRLESAVSTG